MAGTVTKRLSAYFQEYESYHRTFGNKLTHYIAIPMIMLAILGLLSMVKITGSANTGGINLGLILIVIAGLWIAYLDFRVGLSMSTIFLAFYIGSLFMSWQLHIGLFVIGWVVQLGGHFFFEHNRPAFVKNFEHLIIGPTWMFARLLHFYSVPEGKKVPEISEIEKVPA